MTVAPGGVVNDAGRLGVAAGATLDVSGTFRIASYGGLVDAGTLTLETSASLDARTSSTAMRREDSGTGRSFLLWHSSRESLRAGNGSGSPIAA